MVPVRALVRGPHRACRALAMAFPMKQFPENTFSPALRPVALAVWLALASSAQAQDRSEPAAPSLPDVTVSASGLQLGAGEMTTPVTVVEDD